jgi:hypothetical protein
MNIMEVVMCDENIYEKITEEYIKRRNEFIKNKFIKMRWAFLKSFYKRAMGKEDEFKRLRQADIAFQNDFERCLKGHLDDPNVKIDDLEDHVLKLKNHSLKLNFRFSILLIGMAVFSFSLFQLGLYMDIINQIKLASSSIEIIVGVIGWLLTIGIIMLGFLEQVKLKERALAYEELCNILDKFIKYKDIQVK